MVNKENTGESQDPRESRSAQESRGKDEARGPVSRPGPSEVLREARAQFAELTGLTAESVTSFEETEAGW
ncbi:gas vesicle protein GvpO, partial [Streptomyces sp. NPDC056190]|uniref:gas vesicle protein GvpO n=1 Tax=Streptomyces sp. NPDC056190 TaxID=3345741 RepID=UPI0035E10CAE